MGAVATAGWNRIAKRGTWAAAPVWLVVAAVRWAPELFMLTLLIFLFRPPDVSFYQLDRVAFVLLLFVAGLRTILLNQLFVAARRLVLPMIGLAGLALVSALNHLYDPQTWSLFAAKFVVPYALFVIAGSIFKTRSSQRRLETFLLIILAYLIFTALAQFFGVESLVFPRFILDPDRGIHLDRARGPFLQAVANGVTLSILGLVALNAFQRREQRRAWIGVLLAALPLAIFATMTRAVWISFAAIVIWGTFKLDGGLRRACVWLVVAIAVAVPLGLALSPGEAIAERAQEEGPIEIRLAVYQAGLEMFRESAIFGWGINEMPKEVVHRLDDYRLNAYWAHNTYLEILVEHGLVGFALYALILLGLWRLRGQPAGPQDFRRFWPVCLGVYFFNAWFVVMNYQFVNALVFTLGGILAAPKEEHA